MKVEMFPLKSHRNDPFTSYVAAERAERPASGHRLDIYLALCKGPATASEIAERTGLTQIQVARRLSEVRGIRRTDVTRQNPAGNAECVWEVVASPENL
jgi:hypothetical protein